MKTYDLTEVNICIGGFKITGFEEGEFKLEEEKVVARIIHHNDADGLCSAAIAAYWLEKRHEYSEIDFIPIQYGQELDTSEWGEKDQIFMLDFCLQPEQKMLEFINEFGSRLTWIDHHDTAVNFLIKHDIFGDKNPGLCGVIQSTASGVNPVKVSACELTWKYFFPEVLDVPTLVTRIGEWDTWRYSDFKDPSERMYVKAIARYVDDVAPSPKENLKWWEELLEDDKQLKTVIECGATLLAANNKKNIQHMEEDAFDAYIRAPGGVKYHALVVNKRGNSTMFDSRFDPGRHDFMMQFMLTAGEPGKWPHVTVGMYTTKTRELHLGELAKALGEAGPIPSGGGHAGAAGFQCTWNYLESLMLIPPHLVTS